MFARFVNPSSQPPNISADLWKSLSTWYKSPVGEHFGQTEKHILDEQLSNLFGYHLVQIGQIGIADWLESSRIPHCVTLNLSNTVQHHSQNGCSQVNANAQSLPLKAVSVDVMVLPHVLEFSHNPHEVLRGVERVLIPEGHLVLLCFNPLSSWILFRMVLTWWGNMPWCGRFFSRTRVKDWLALLGFEIVTCQSYFYRPPIQHRGIMSKLEFMEKMGQRLWPALGGGYMIVAKKRVNTLTPIRPRWKTRSLVSTGMEASNKVSSVIKRKSA